MAILGRARIAALVALAGWTCVAGCAQLLDFNECTTDPDCAKVAPMGGKAYCTSDHLCVTQLPMERLCPETIGVGGAGSLQIASLLDRANPVDTAMENSFRLAVDEINMRQAGASQPPLQVHLCDTASDPDQTLHAAQVAASQFHVSAILGPSTSGGVVAINAFVVQQGILVMSPSATAVDISSLADSDLVWRTAPSDVLQAALLAKEVQQDTPVPFKVDTLYVNTVYGKGLSDAFAAQYKGSPSVGNRILFSSGGADLRDALNKLAADQPSQVLIVADVEAPAVVAMLGGLMSLNNTHFFFTDAAKTSAIFGTAMAPVPPSVLSRIRGTAPGHPTSNTYMDFASAYRNRFGMAPDTTAFAATAYDAVYLVAIAAAATSGHLPTGPDLVAGLRKLKSSGSPVHVGSSGYLMALSQEVSGGVYLDGASGPLVFDTNGDPKMGTYEFWGIDTNGPPRFVSLPQ